MIEKKLNYIIKIIRRPRSKVLRIQAVTAYKACNLKGLCKSTIMIGRGAISFSDPEFKANRFRDPSLFCGENYRALRDITGLNYRARALKAPIFARLLTAAFVIKSLLRCAKISEFLQWLVMSKMPLNAQTYGTHLLLSVAFHFSL
jgi:hypothetical protein